MKRLILATTALSLSIPAYASTDPVADTRQIMAGTVTTTKVKNEYLSGKRDGTSPFQGALKAYKAVRAAEVPPTPVPVPVPPPAPPVGYDPAPSLAGRAPISSNFDITPSLVATALPSSGKPDVVGAFRFDCQAGQLRYDDPIVYPGQRGKSHLHQFYGNLSADANSTYESLRAKGDSTCGDPLNRSAYWMPAMLDGKGNAVRPEFVSIYYKRRPKSDPQCSLTSGDPKAMGNCVNLPNGLKFIFGYDMLTGKAPTGFIQFGCQTRNAAGQWQQMDVQFPNLAEALKVCPVGGLVGTRIEAPNCWDGKNLDSPNHRDHVAYGSYGDWGYYRCPTSHPYVIPSFTLGAWYTVDANRATWSLSSDAMIPNVPAGTTFHADFFMAWDPKVHQMWEDNCLDKLLSCSAGNLGNGWAIKDAWVREDTRPKVVALPAS